jgi:hypothetical protein
MSDDVTDGFQIYEDATLVGLGIGPNLHDNRRNVLAVGFQQCSLYAG